MYTTISFIEINYRTKEKHVEKLLQSTSRNSRGSVRWKMADTADGDREIELVPPANQSQKIK